MLQYDLVENLLTPAPDDFMAQVTNVRSLDINQIADLMLRKGAGLTKSDILSVLEVYHEVVCDAIADGGAVTTPLFNAFPSISGVFMGTGDSFNAARHKVNVNLNTGIALRDAVKKVKVERVHVSEPIPYITEVKDTLSNSVNETITLGGVIQIKGSRLKFLGEQATNGIFLIAEDGTETKCTSVVENKPGRLIVMIPAGLPTGSYQLEVRSTYSTAAGRESKQLKVGRFCHVLKKVDRFYY